MRALFASAGLVALLAAGSAFAAEADPAPVTDVGEIIVTGEKTSRSIQETTTSVAVVTAERIAEENLQSFFDIVQRTANMSETYGNAGFTIRGIRNDNVSGGGSGGLASVYVDGAPMPDSGIAYSPLGMWDIGQVEVLRGPQSTLQGRNALAGAVIIRSQDPTFDWDFKGRLLLSDAEDQSIAIAGGGPIVDDQLAFRLSAEKGELGGFVYNKTRKTQEDALDWTTVRGKLLFTPAALPGLTAGLTVLHDERDGAYRFTYARTDVPDYFDNRISLDDAPNFASITTDIATLELGYELSDRLALTSISSWSKVDNFSGFDNDGTAAPLGSGTQTANEKTFTQELRLGYEGERLEGLVGLYYSTGEGDYNTTSITNVVTPLPTLIGVLQGPPFGLDLGTATLAANLYVAALPVIPVDYDGDASDEVNTIAVFGDGRWHVTDKLSVLAGFRYDREEYTQANSQTATFIGTHPDPSLYGPLAPVIGGLNMVVDMFVAQANASNPASTREFEAFLPKLGLRYEFNDDMSAAFVVQRGYRSGGSTINIARSAVVAYDPEYTWNYEASFRSRWLDGALTLNANAFYIDWTDQQVNVNLGLNEFDYQTENAGASHLYGFEIELTHQPTEYFDWYASLGNVQTKFDEFNVNVGVLDVDLTGSEFAFAPKWTVSAGANWRSADGWSANLNANYRGDAFSDTGVIQSAYAIKARTVVNGKVGYEAEHWAVYAYANNLFDEEYIQYNQAAWNRAMLGAPRVLGVVLETRW